ncbi:unnamed protein product, partial [Iphiclides podalirius]
MLNRAILCILSCLYVLTAARVQTVNGKIKITVGTTAGCGDTVRFIDQQLSPAYELYKEFLDIEFVPWGRTRRESSGDLTCQFGPNDCWANQLHRCALHLLEGDQDAQVDYMSCEFSPPYPSFLQNSYQCAIAASLSLDEVNNCISSVSRDLEDVAEAVSDIPMQIINFVPFITFNDVIDIDTHNLARTQLASLLCSALADDPTTGVTNC